jgi:hypothetical protein
MATSQPFSQFAIRYLFITGCALLGFVGLVLLISVVARLVYSDQVPPGFSFSYSDFLKENLWLLIAGFGLLALRFVFQKGYEMQVKEKYTV